MKVRRVLPFSTVALLASLALHGAFFAALARFGFAPPAANVVGGGGLGGMEVRIRPADMRTTLTAEDAEDAEERGGTETELLAQADAPPESGASGSASESVAASGAASESASASASASESASGAESESASASAPASESASVPAATPSAPPGPVAAVLDGAGVPEPRYPPSCRRLGHSGIAIVRVEVGADGRPGRVEMIQSAGCIELDRSALEALRRARFRPAQSFGTPVASVVEQRVRFKLR